MTRLDKEFHIGSVEIPVTVHSDGMVNVGATSTISAEDFARLAWAVLSQSNWLSRGHVGFLPSLVETAHEGWED